MVGIGTALALQSRGHDVTVIDRRGPGEETSHGNAGIIQTEAAEPYAFPRDPRVMLRYLAGRDNDLRYALPALLRMAPSLARYWQNSSPGHHARISLRYAKLTSRATTDHGPLIDAAGLEPMIRRDGFNEIFRSTAAFDARTAYAARMAESFGIPYLVQGPDTFCIDEPGFRTRMAGAIRWTGAWSCADPGGLVRGYANLLMQRGGRIIKGDANEVAAAGAGWRLGPTQAEHVVVCLGPWSPQLLARFGYRVSMLRKRGYHRHFKAAAPVNRPFVDTDNGVVLSPMRAGLRMSSGAALVDMDAPSDPAQLGRAEKALRHDIELGTRAAPEPWFGHRPCLPDMLPLTGPLPRHTGLWANFGHGHQGFTLGPTTGTLLAEAMAGEGDTLHAALAPENRPFAIR
ncbi:amino acid oxidoreductase [Salipiger pallidus]|uniref:Amino acid oxidoreductase n=2 Tax=Salipiger pallidus TaxID=1775170 RepID=A0A8J2ZNA9_9RHOB|nr:amino acid oxidoreductase [Salipiger pallidus]